MGEAAKALADAPANAARKIELMRMYRDIMRIFHISERRPLNNDEIARVEEYTRVLDRMLLKGPVRPPPQRDIINQDLLDLADQPDILNQDQLDQLREEPAGGEPAEDADWLPADFGHQFAEMYPEAQRELDHFDRERQRLMDQELSDDEGKHDEPHVTWDSEASFSLGSSLRSIPTLGSSVGSTPLPLRLTTRSAPSPLGDSSSASSTLSTRSAPATYHNELTVKPQSPAGFDRILGMIDALETRNPMAGETYTRPGLEERKEDPFQTPTPRTLIPTPTPKPTLVEQVAAADKDLMFDALKLIKQRFNLRGRAKNNILTEIRSRPNSKAANSLAALTTFAKNSSSSVADASKSRSQIQGEWMRNYLNTNHPQRETRGRPKL